MPNWLIIALIMSERAVRKKMPWRSLPPERGPPVPLAAAIVVATKHSNLVTFAHISSIVQSEALLPALFPFPPHKLYTTLYFTNFYYSSTCNNNVTFVSNGLSWYIRVTFLILARKIVMALMFLLWYGAEKEIVPFFLPPAVKFSVRRQYSHP